MTNGTLTKQLLKAAQTQTGKQLLDTARNIMRRFPLSSEKLLYDSDKPKVTDEAWLTLLRAAHDTDKEKLAECNSLRKEAGLKPDNRYGRYDAVSPLF